MTTTRQVFSRAIVLSSWGLKKYIFWEDKLILISLVSLNQKNLDEKKNLDEYLQEKQNILHTHKQDKNYLKGLLLSFCIYYIFFS